MGDFLQCIDRNRGGNLGFCSVFKEILYFCKKFSAVERQLEEGGCTVFRCDIVIQFRSFGNGEKNERLRLSDKRQRL